MFEHPSVPAIQGTTATTHHKAADLPVPRELVPSEHAPSDGCEAGVTELGEFAGCEYGIWEMSTGVMHDTEAEELFVVLEGNATVEFLEPRSASIEIAPGSVVTFAAGTKTRWTVHSERLRKVYLAP